MKERSTCIRRSRPLFSLLSLGAVAALAACNAPLDPSLHAALDGQELVIGQADVALVSFGPSVDACGVTACYSVTGLARPEVSHFIIGTPDGCDGAILGVTLDGVALADPDIGDFKQKGCAAVHGVKLDTALASGQEALVCIAYDQELTLAEVAFQVKAGRQCETGSIPGPTCNAEEACDGRDNDCDGAIDEDFGVGGACTVGVGACEASGELVCTEDGAVCNAIAGEPSAELCGTNIDEDCDGETDEGFDVGDACDNGQLGVCAAQGELVCADDLLGTVCNAPHIEPCAELCGNLLDDDCDGATDEGFDVGSLCSAGVGACESFGEVVCTADGAASFCNALPLPPGEEVCNAEDDDCDGETDEGLTLNGEQIEEPTQVDIGQALVTLISHLLDAENNTTQVCYEVGSDFSPSLSHFVVGTDAACDEKISSVTLDGQPAQLAPASHNQESQGCAPIHGVKDDQGMNGGDKRTLCLVYDGLYDLGALSFQAKAGTQCETGLIEGVLCEELDVCAAE